MHESINTTVCIKLNNIRGTSVIQMLFYSRALSQECSNRLGEHNQIRESTFAAYNSVTNSVNKGSKHQLFQTGKPTDCNRGLQ